MLWIFGIVIVLIMGAVAVVAAGRGSGLSPAYDDRHDVLVPTSRWLTGSDLRTLRFSVTWRGYRPAEVDALLDRLAAELESRDGAVATDHQAPVEAPVEQPAAPVAEPVAEPVDEPVDAPESPADASDDATDH